MILMDCHRISRVGQRPHRNHMRCGFLIVSYLLTACTDDKPVAFPDGLEPLEDIKVEAPVGTTADPFPEEINWVSGDEGDYGWIHARGYIKSSPSQTWAALREPTVFVDIDKVVEYTVEEQNSSEYDYVYVVDNLVEDIVDVEFVVEWRHGVVDGEPNEPNMVGVRWQKVSGTEFIESLEGSIVLLSVKDEPNITEVQIIEHLSALMDQEDNAIDYVTGLYNRWRSY